MIIRNQRVIFPVIFFVVLFFFFFLYRESVLSRFVRKVSNTPDPIKKIDKKTFGNIDLYTIRLVFQKLDLTPRTVTHKDGTNFEIIASAVGKMEGQLLLSQQIVVPLLVKSDGFISSVGYKENTSIDVLKFEEYFKGQGYKEGDILVVYLATNTEALEQYEREVTEEERWFTSHVRKYTVDHQDALSNIENGKISSDTILLPLRWSLVRK